jgi:hypothetical protein
MRPRAARVAFLHWGLTATPRSGGCELSCPEHSSIGIDVAIRLSGQFEIGLSLPDRDVSWTRPWRSARMLPKEKPQRRSNRLRLSIGLR